MKLNLLKVPSNFGMVRGSQNKDFPDKPRQYEKAGKKIVKIDERYVEYFGLVSFPLLPGDMDDEEEIGLFEE